MLQIKAYQQLLEGHIYFGSADDVEDMVCLDEVEVIVDLRAEATQCASSRPGIAWQRIPLGDDAVAQTLLLKAAIDAVVTACRAGKRVGFHCGGGKGRTGAVAVGVLLELGICDTLSHAEQHARQLRPVIQLKPPMRQSLQTLYPHA
ncbi:tyrosine-protein phosphatase [Chromobacterium piscinae]|uniref:protein-tyrosine phosphatase family protein n=1 Tax=Chromobacterium TaxID=535 RepID=UPI001E3C68D8|nr:tyrosine-protein phosphatase [Chromobacterium piscinae]MCD5330580.1 tyrosine-protein phosphatase [Chromobacterium piscinae]